MFIGIPLCRNARSYIKRGRSPFGKGERPLYEKMRTRPLLEPAPEALGDAIGIRAASADRGAHGSAERTAGDERREQAELLGLLVAAHHLEAAPEHDDVARPRARDARTLAAADRIH